MPYLVSPAFTIAEICAFKQTHMDKLTPEQNFNSLTLSALPLTDYFIKFAQIAIFSKPKKYYIIL